MPQPALPVVPVSFVSIQAPTMIYSISSPQHHMVPNQTQVKGDSTEANMRLISVTLYFSHHRPTPVQRESQIV